MTNKYYTVVKQDIGRRSIILNGRKYIIHPDHGPLQSGDVGKRIYMSEYVCKLESDTEYQERTNHNV